MKKRVPLYEEFVAEGLLRFKKSGKYKTNKELQKAMSKANKDLIQDGDGREWSIGEFDDDGHTIFVIDKDGTEEEMDVKDVTLIV